MCSPAMSRAHTLLDMGNVKRKGLPLALCPSRAITTNLRHSDFAKVQKIKHCREQPLKGTDFLAKKPTSILGPVAVL